MCRKDLADHVLSASGEIHNVKLKGLFSQDANGLQIILVYPLHVIKIRLRLQVQF